MESKKQEQIIYLDKIPEKFIWSGLFGLKEPFSFFERIIQNINFYIFNRKEINSLLIQEIKSTIKENDIRFVTFSFVNSKQYFSIYFNQNCILIWMEGTNSNLILYDILFQLGHKKRFFISAILEDYLQLKTLINKINDEKEESERIDIEKVVFLKEKDQENIYLETQKFMEHIDKIIQNNPIINLTKYSISSYVIGRFYIKTLYLQKDEIQSRYYLTNKLQEFQNDEFITLREITINIILVFHKKTNQIFVQKILKQRPLYRDFFKMIEIYKKINELKKFVKCYGYIKNQYNQIDSLIIEYMNKGTLANYIVNDKNISFDDKIIISFQLIEQLYLLHSNDIIYRDLKPNNIFVNQDCKIFIGDFDMSRFYTSDESLTCDIGSLLYSSPEMINSEKYEYSTDIYSYGLTLYYIFIGENPFQKTSNNNICNLITNEFIKNIILKCLKNNPNERPKSIEILDKFIVFAIEQFFKNESAFLSYLLSDGIDIVKHKIDILINLKLKLYSEKHLLLGSSYFEDTDIKKYIKILIYNLTLSANQNDSQAQFSLGLIYDNGVLVPKDINKAIHYLTLSSNQNNIEAQYNLGYIYLRNSKFQNINKSIYYLTLSANQGNSDAQQLLGYAYYYCNFIPKDIDKAIYYTALSANQNNSKSQFNLGMIYLEDSKYKNINKSIYYLTLSANQGNSNAQCQLGYIYLFDESIQNINQSVYYLTLSANNNSPDSQCILGYIYSKKKFQLRNIKKAFYYLSYSSKNNHKVAQFFLAKMYLKGKYIERNIEKAIYYLTLSADQFWVPSQIELGMIYYFGMYDIPKDINKAIHYFKMASSFNDSTAKNYLGVIYKNGEEIGRNIQYSIIYFKEAISLTNYNNSLYNLAKIYYFGIDFEKDIEESVKLLEKSTENGFIPSIIFLYFIYSTNDGIKQKYNIKSLYNIIIHSVRKEFINLMIFILSNVSLFTNQVFEFIQQNDLVFIYKDDSYAIKFISTIFGLETTLEVKEVKIIKKNIDKNFYDGFYSE